MFSRSDIVSIVIRLGLSSDEFGTVAKKLEVLQRESELIILKIQEDLAKLDELEIKLSENAASPNFAIIKADVLQYDVNKKTYGIITEMLRVSQRLANLMGIKGNFSQLDEQLELLGANPVLQCPIVGRTTRS